MKSIVSAILAAFLTFVALPVAAKGDRAVPATPAPQSAQATPSPLLATMKQELDREMAVLGKADPAAYFIAYTATDATRANVVGSNGALLSSREARNRWLEAQVRVGSYELDNTRSLRGGSLNFVGGYGEPVPIEDDPAVLRRAMWRETENQYRAAAEAFIKVTTSREVQAQTAEQEAPDFSREEPQVFHGRQVTLTVNRRPWEEKVRLYTRFFRASPSVLNSIVTFSAQAQNQYQITSEGTELQFGQIRYRLELFIQGQSFRWNGHQPLLQLRLDGARRGAG